MRKVKFDASILLLVLIAILLVAGIIFVVFFLREDPFQDSIAEEKTINTLFVIEKDGKPLSSYVLLYYPATRRAAVFDIPGSLGLIIQQINRMDRIDAIYDPRRITPFKNEIESLLGIDISFSIVITLENFGKITDLIQGVEVFIPSALNLYQDGHILFPSGINRLDGDKAKVYISYELPEEIRELANVRRQRFFLGFLKALGEQNQFITDPQAARLFQSFIRTDMNQRTLMRLLDEFAGIDTDRTSIQSVSGEIRNITGQALIFPHMNGALIRDIVSQTLIILVQPPGSLIGNRVFTVEILNGTPQTGLAGRTAELLRSFGYNIISIGNADRNDHDRTLIIDRSGYREMAVSFGDIIRCSNIRFDSDAQVNPEIDFTIQRIENQSDFTLILGRDFNGRFVTD